MTSWHAGGIPGEYHFHKHKGRRRGGGDRLIEILQCCSEDREQQTGQGQRVIKQEGAVAALKSRATQCPGGYFFMLMYLFFAANILFHDPSTGLQVLVCKTRQ